MLTLLALLAGLVLTASPSSAADGGVLDGYVIGHLPPGIASSVSDFESEPDDGVRFTQRVWERQTDAGHAVDLTIIVMRGERFTSASELRDFLAEHHERDPASWAEATIAGHPGFKDDNSAYWLAAPGTAISVTLDTTRFNTRQLLATAEGIRKQ